MKKFLPGEVLIYFGYGFSVRIQKPSQWKMTQTHFMKMEFKPTWGEHNGLVAHDVNQSATSSSDLNKLSVFSDSCGSVHTSCWCSHTRYKKKKKIPSWQKLNTEFSHVMKLPRWWTANTLCSASVSLNVILIEKEQVLYWLRLSNSGRTTII